MTAGHTRDRLGRLAARETEADVAADGHPVDDGPAPTPAPTFRQDLAALLNRHCAENGSNTPDFLLAAYLADCLAAFDRAVAAREQYHGRDPEWNHGFGVGIGPEPTPASAS